MPVLVRLLPWWLALLSFSARADVAALEASLRAAAPQARVALAELQALDLSLLQPAALYPSLGRAPLPRLQAIYRYRRQCPSAAPAMPAELRRFETALCRGETLPVAWFARHRIHPLGGSYAWHYLQRHPEAAGSLQPFLHLRERPDAFGGLGRLSDDNLAALLGGDDWLLQGGALWRQDGRAWLRYDETRWRPLARRAGLALLPFAEGMSCNRVLGQVCVRQLPPAPWWWRAAAALSLFLAGGVLAYGVWQRRRLLKERQFVLQMLTHELRTPIAGLGNAVEAFRADFDRLPDGARDGFGRLADGVLRLRQLAEASRHYLSVRGGLEPPQPLPLGEWLDAAAERHGVAYCLERDRTLALPAYWLGLCLDNLLRNALTHGRPPVRIHAAWRAGRLRLAVSDGGMLPRYRLARLGRQAAGGEGMGLGLAIVRRVMARLGGNLRLEGPPTTFVLELPCDDIAD
ncbi:histidine kinase [Xenophilus sp. AP218F]|nr:histidine kinase [Xenophilus sp. AP218F]